MKLRHLESHLEGVEQFKDPKVSLEQYVTSPHIAACMTHTAETKYGDIDGKCVADLGSGCGILAIAASMMGCETCVAFDIDSDALDICLENCQNFELDNEIECVQANVCDLPNLMRFRCFFDTVIMNPPFGTKHNKGIDVMFLEVASKLATTAIYSLNKTSTRSHIMRKAREFDLVPEVVAELRYDLPASYKFHKMRTKDIEVDFFRFKVT